MTKPALKPTPKNADLGKKPELAWLPIGKLSVDPKYQRDTGSRRSKHLIEKIAAGFRWSRFGVVLAVAHKGGWHVIDGQHRVEAARQRGDIAHVPAVVLPHATIEAAAADFVAINRDRVAVTPYHIHYAQLAAGDPEALAMDRVCKAAGIEICRYPVPLANMKPGQTLAVASIGRLIKLKGEAFAVQVLERVAAAAGDVPGRCGARTIRSFAEDALLRVHDGHNAAFTRPVGRSQAKIRNCLRCQKPFKSEGPGNRLCNACKGVRPGMDE